MRVSSKPEATHEAAPLAPHRRVVGVLLLLAAGVLAVYWTVQLASWVGHGTALDLAFMAAVGSTMTLLIVLAALHFLPPLPQRVTRWRIPAAIALAALSLPLTETYGFGAYAAVCALVIARGAWRENRRSVGVWPHCSQAAPLYCSPCR